MSPAAVGADPVSTVPQVEPHESDTSLSLLTETHFSQVSPAVWNRVMMMKMMMMMLSGESG